MAAPAVQGQSQSFLSSLISVQVCEKVLITERAAGTARHSHFVFHKALEPLEATVTPAQAPPPPDRCNQEDGPRDATSTRPRAAKHNDPYLELQKNGA